MLNIGITSRCMSGLTISDTVREISKAGFQSTELCFCHADLGSYVYNGRGDLSDITPAKVREAADSFRMARIEPVSLGMYTDLRSPDDGEAEKTLDYIKRYIEFAAESGIGYISSECGFDEGRRGVSAVTYESDYERLKNMLRTACLEAEKSGVHLCLEAGVLDIIPSPRRMKSLIEELEAESGVRLGALLSPAYFIANSDEEGMFCYLKHDISYIHGCDGKINSAGCVSIGEGDTDWVKFMSCYIRFTDRTPFILDNCGRESCRIAKEKAEAYYEEAFRALISRMN